MIPDRKKPAISGKPVGRKPADAGKPAEAQQTETTISTGVVKPGRKVVIPNTPDAQPDTMSNQPDDPEARRIFRQSLFLIGGAFLVMLFFFTVAFFLAVRGAERTVVPDIVNRELTDALVLLQERELYPRLQAKFTGNPSDKGMVIDQDPGPGLYVKAGRRVNVTVSRGAVVDQVEDYVGSSLADLRARLVSLFSTFEPLLVIREPVTYIYDESEPGTILSQSPKPGTQLADPVELILIVSRGSLDRPVKLPDLTTFTAENAMRSLARVPLRFVLVEDAVPPEGTVPRITSQSPQPETEVGLDRVITLRYSRPATWPSGYRYGLFDHTLPEYPVPVLLEAVIREPGDEDRNLFSMAFSGGRVSFPYVVPVGTGIVLTINGEEVHRLDILSEP